jgi:hypothetical protein
MSRHKNKQHSDIEDLLRAADTPAPTPKPIASPIPKIHLPKEEPDPTKPIDWFESYERHVRRD